MDNKELKVIYDIVSVPDGITIDQVFNIMGNGGIVIWDSQNGGQEPKIIESSNLHIYDVGFLTDEMFKEKFSNISYTKDDIF